MTKNPRRHKPIYVGRIFTTAAIQPHSDNPSFYSNIRARVRKIAA